MEKMRIILGFSFCFWKLKDDEIKKKIQVGYHYKEGRKKYATNLEIYI